MYIIYRPLENIRVILLWLLGLTSAATTTDNICISYNISHTCNHECPSTSSYTYAFLPQEQGQEQGQGQELEEGQEDSMNKLLQALGHLVQWFESVSLDCTNT